VTDRRAARGWRGLRRGLGLLLAALLLAAAWEAWTWPRVAPLASRPPATTAFIERDRAAARAAGRPDRLAWTWVPYGAISPHLKRAVVAAEDIGFFGHSGFDFFELRAAVEKAVEEGEAPRGASTITQQLAKNLWLSPSRNPWRKVKEAILTWQLERALSKRRILELYLNVVQFGPGVYGAEAAARRFFGKPAGDLTEDEAARLAAGLPRPSQWHPGVTSRAYQAYVEAIRRRTARAEFLGRLI
jgi:monofunctional biosynthetic peptidoglycan transglycosylase